MPLPKERSGSGTSQSPVVEGCFPVPFGGVDVPEYPHGLEGFELVSEMEVAEAAFLDGRVDGVSFDPSSGFFCVWDGGCVSALDVVNCRDYSRRGRVADV